MKMTLRLVVPCLVALCLVLAHTAHAAQKSFVMLPFTVNGPQDAKYLSQSIPSSMKSKLAKPGVLDAKNSQQKAASAADAGKALRQAGADYAVWGTVNVLGTEATIEVHSVDKAGKTWSKSQQSRMSNLPAAIQNLTSALGREVMGVSVAAASSPAAAPARGGQMVNQMNSDIVVNETGQQQVYLNPQFRYQGAGANDGSRLRTQRIKTNMVDMAVADFNGDGRNEVAVIDNHKLTIYDWGNDGRLKPLGETTVARSNYNYTMRVMDINRDGAQDMIICTYEEDSSRPYSFFFSFKGNKLTQLADRVPYFVGVLRMPPHFTPTLVGQGYDSLKLFAPGVRMMVKNGNKYELGTRIDLPSGATPFNVTWLPGSAQQGGDQLVMLTENERIKLFQGKNNNLIHTTMERFSGSAVGMDHYKGMPGLGVDKKYQLPGKYYAPMRMIAADLGRTGEYALLINKPISTAAQFFDRYRYFPQGEIHAMFWDGVGLALKWKTRRIRGSVAQIDLADVNNDGILDLVVGLNTSPDLGVGSRQSMVTAYPLDVSATNPNVPADLSDFEVNPNN